MNGILVQANAALNGTLLAHCRLRLDPILFFHSAPNLVVAFSQAHQHQLTPGFRAIEALGVYLSVGALGL